MINEASKMGNGAVSAVVTRFAPSPTGYLHVGNARTALINWLHARRHGGRFILRIDDTDPERSREDYARAIEEDLRWLGLDWDQKVRQSERADRYETAIERLKAAGRLYPAYETPEELELGRARARRAGRPPVYDRAALKLGEAQRRAHEAAGRRPHWRFLLQHEAVAWDDLIRGPVRFEGADLSDPVLVREDGQPLYTLTSVVDDIELGVRQVIRGEDHVTNTAPQIQLFRALDAEPPAFGHHSLLAGPGGEKLSKRAGDLSLRVLRERGIEAMTVASLLARLGTADPVEPRASLDALAEGFDLSRFGRAMARFDVRELEGLNARVLQLLPYAAVADRLEVLGLGGAALAAMGLDDGEPFWLAVRGNLERLSDAAQWVAVCTGPVTPVIEEAGASVVDTAAALLSKGPFDQDTWGTWTQDVRALSGAKGRALFRPLRLALTGREHGPEMRNLLPLIGPARARARLRGRTA